MTINRNIKLLRTLGDVFDLAQRVCSLRFDADIWEVNSDLD